MWTIKEAQELISKAQPKALEYDYNLALGGGVLNKGFSDNDLDIIAIPRSSKRYPLENELLTFLCGDFQSPQELFNYVGLEKLEGRRIFRFQVGPDKLVDLIFIDYLEKQKYK